MDRDPFGRMFDTWQSVAWPRDPSEVPVAPSGERGGAQATEWSDAWMSATSWWADAIGEGQGAVPDAPGRLLVEIVEGLAHACRGRRFAIDLGGRRLCGVLNWVLLDRRDGDYAVQLEIADVDWDGVVFERVAVSVGSVVLTAPPNVTVTASEIELAGGSPIGPLVQWLNAQIGRGRLSVTEDSLVEAAPSRGGWRVVVDPAVIEGTVVVELRAVRWRSVQLRIPRWLRLTRQFALPPLPAGVAVSEARRRRSSVESRLYLQVVSRRLNLSDIRDAIATRARAS